MTHKAFVAGATGYTGQAVVAQLRQQGIETLAHIRPGSSKLDHWRPRFEELGAVVDTSPWEREAIGKTVRDFVPTLVFALLGTTKARMKRVARAGGNAEQQSYEAVDYGLSKMVLDATHEQASQARFVYLSSGGVGEDSRMPYLEVRWRLEQDIQKLGIDYLIARPCFITGSNREEDRPGERIAATILDGALNVFSALGAKKLKAKYRSVTNEELAQGLIKHGLRAESSRKILESDQIHDD
jgi:uncharacterized protein YbjT (DUF2867 family)